jgi:mRNA-degrading endonuclease RelE of RelBE toxin-antitoxin system
MTSHISKRFRHALRQLPVNIQSKARDVYRLFKQNPYHKSLKFKQIHSTKPIYSVRVGLNHRAVGVKDDNAIIWFWIGSHEDYNKLIARL